MKGTDFLWVCLNAHLCITVRSSFLVLSSTYPLSNSVQKFIEGHYINETKKKKAELLFPPCDCFGQIKPLLLIRKTWGCMREDSHSSRFCLHHTRRHSPSISKHTVRNTTENQKTNQLPTLIHTSPFVRDALKSRIIKQNWGEKKKKKN